MDAFVSTVYDERGQRGPIDGVQLDEFLDNCLDDWARHCVKLCKVLLHGMCEVKFFPSAKLKQQEVQEDENAPWS